MALDLLIQQASVVTAAGVEVLDLAIEGGYLVELASQIDLPAQQILQAHGLHAFPGVIDVHVHFNEPGRTHWEGLASGSAALAAGGGTLFADMPLNSDPPLLSLGQFEAKKMAALANAHTDFALWGGLTPHNLERLPELAQAGVIGFKAFMSNSGIAEFGQVDDYTLYTGMQTAAQLGRTVAVHAENDGITAGLTAHLRSAGRTAIRDYLASRPAIAEVEAVQRALLLARETGCALHLVHLSTVRAVQLALEARGQGVQVSLETCPHYLVFDEEDLERMGAVLKCAPPLRSGVERQQLWSLVLQNQFDLIASDHSPAPADMKESSDFFAVWGGIAGVQSSLAVMLTEGWEQRGLPLPAIANLLAHNPAQRFGLTHRGRLEVGYHADLSLVDLSTSVVHQPQQLLTRHRLSPYLGRRFRGEVRHTLVRGQTVFAGGQVQPLLAPQLVQPG